MYGFQFKDVNLMFEMTTPSGEVKSKQFIIPVYTDEKELLSNCAVDYCDLETLIEDNFKFTETGQYKITVEHIMETNPIPNVMAVGLIIDKKEK